MHFRASSYSSPSFWLQGDSGNLAFFFFFLLEKVSLIYGEPQLFVRASQHIYKGMPCDSSMTGVKKELLPPYLVKGEFTTWCQEGEILLRVSLFEVCFEHGS